MKRVGCFWDFGAGDGPNLCGCGREIECAEQYRSVAARRIGACSVEEEVGFDFKRFCRGSWRVDEAPSMIIVSIGR